MQSKHLATQPHPLAPHDFRRVTNDSICSLTQQRADDMRHFVFRFWVLLLLLPSTTLASTPQNFVGHVTGNDVRLTWDPLSPTDSVRGRQEPLYELIIFHYKPGESRSQRTFLPPSALEYTFNDLTSGDHRFWLRAIYAEDPDEDATTRDSQEITVTVEDISHLPPTFTFPSLTGHYSRSTTEGGNVVFTVEKSHVTNSSYSINYTTAHLTAANSSAHLRADEDDYQSVSGTLTFAPSELTKPIIVATNQDQVSEYNEQRRTVHRRSQVGT